MELRKRNKSKDNISQKKTDKFYREKIKHLLNAINIEEYKKADIPFIILLFFSKIGFKSSPQVDIIKYISNPNIFPSLTHLINLKDDIIYALKTNNMFEINKKKVLIHLEKSFNYLTSYYEKSMNTNSSFSNQIIAANVLDFPIAENDVEYVVSDNHLNMSFVIDEDNFDNSFTFGEQSQIKFNKRHKYIFNNSKEEYNKTKNNTDNPEELVNKVVEKYIPKFEIVFDENKYMENIMKFASDFFINYKKENKNEKNINSLDVRIKKLNTLFIELNAKIEPFNKLSSCFNEEKNELFTANSVIIGQLKLMELICENDIFPLELYTSEKEIYSSYKDVFKKLLNKIQEDFSEVKKMERTINNIISNLKNELKGISDEFNLELNDKEGKFFNLIKDITKTKTLPININMKEALTLFYTYIVDFEKTFTKVEESSKKKKSEE